MPITVGYMPEAEMLARSAYQVGAQAYREEQRLRAEAQRAAAYGAAQQERLAALRLGQEADIAQSRLNQQAEEADQRTAAAFALEAMRQNVTVPGPDGQPVTVPKAVYEEHMRAARDAEAAALTVKQDRANWMATAIRNAPATMRQRLLRLQAEDALVAGDPGLDDAARQNAHHQIDRQFRQAVETMPTPEETAEFVDRNVVRRDGMLFYTEASGLNVRTDEVALAEAKARAAEPTLEQKRLKQASDEYDTAARTLLPSLMVVDENGVRRPPEQSVFDDAIRAYLTGKRAFMGAPPEGGAMTRPALTTQPAPATRPADPEPAPEPEPHPVLQTLLGAKTSKPADGANPDYPGWPDYYAIDARLPMPTKTPVTDQGQYGPSSADRDAYFDRAKAMRLATVRLDLLLTKLEQAYTRPAEEVAVKQIDDHLQWWPFLIDALKTRRPEFFGKANR